MRNATPAGKNKSDGENEKNSGKKLVQARLPFKIFTPGSTTSMGETIVANDEEHTSEANAGFLDFRKRKLSYDSSGSDAEISPNHTPNDIKENLKDVLSKKQKTLDEDVVIVLEDSGTDEGHNQNKTVDQTNSTKAAVTSAKKKSKKSLDSEKRGVGSAQKLQIKLPVSRKNKKRKSARFSTESDIVGDAVVTAESSDDIEMIACELNPQKRPKHDLFAKDNENKEKRMDKGTGIETQEDELQKTDLVTDDEKSTKEGTTKVRNKEMKLKLDTDQIVFDKKEDAENSLAEDESIAEEIDTSDEGDIKESDENSSKSESSKASNIESEVKVQDNHLKKTKHRTAKQEKYMEQRRKAREEKERKIAEERRQKQIEKEERELAKKRDREEREEIKKKEREEKEEQRKREKEEKEEQRKREREEKDEQKRREREEKEKKRLAEIEAKNEEKRKRIEAKEEEQRKKEKEREDAEQKKRKAAEAFTKFFVSKPQQGNSDFDQTSNDSSNLNEATLAFQPFQIKGDMKMAPILRKHFSFEAKNNLDKLLGIVAIETENEAKKTNGARRLYLEELKSGQLMPSKWKKAIQGRHSRDEDVILIEDELEREGQEIIEETHPRVEHYRAKFYKFYENRRPPYYGTWRKRSDKVTPRRPFNQDKAYFDYEIDSDLEWEEEEPGESLDGSDDDKEKESEDDDYEVDNEWFVPHGHLSEEEMQNEDEIGGDDNTREAQKAKLKLLQQEFAQEMKKKTEKIKPRLVGCIWVDENGNHPDLCPPTIWEKLSSRSMWFSERPVTEELTNPEKMEPTSPSNTYSSNGLVAEKTTEKLKPITINEKLQKDLVRLIHGNSNSKMFLIKEFIAYVEANEDTIKNGDVRGPLKSMVKDKIDEFAEWKAMELSNITKPTKTKKAKKYLCWVVNDETLEKMGMKNLELKNEWQYLLTPKRKEKEMSTEAGVETNSVAVLDTSDALNFNKIPGLETPKFLDAGDDISADRIKNSKESINSSQKNIKEGQIKKKRVPLLMSVGRGQQFATPTKNALISQFLKKSSEARENKSSSMVTDDIIILE